MGQDVSDPEDLAAFVRDFEEQERLLKKSKSADPTGVKRSATAAELPDEPEPSPGAASSGGDGNVTCLDMSSLSVVGAIVDGTEYNVYDDDHAHGDDDDADDDDDDDDAPTQKH